MCWRSTCAQKMCRVTVGSRNLLVGDEDLPAIHDLRKRNRFVLLPVLDGLVRVDEDDEVILLALVVDLSLLRGSARHCGGCRVCCVKKEVRLWMYVALVALCLLQM